MIRLDLIICKAKGIYIHSLRQLKVDISIIYHLRQNIYLIQSHGECEEENDWFERDWELALVVKVPALLLESLAVADVLLLLS